MALDPHPLVDPSEIARRSRSNLAFALACLPAERRRDMISFYAFCRLIDDIADEEGYSVLDRRIQLGAWRRIVRGEQAPANAVAREVVILPAKYGFSPALLEEIIDGVSMDLEQHHYDTFQELLKYCYKVASVVGLVSLHIFGSTDPRAKDYAINLGYALQLTNILRDIKADWENEERIYLPREDLERFDYTSRDIAARRYTPAFFALMEFQTQRAFNYYEEAISALPRQELSQLAAAEAMRQIYQTLLIKMRAEGYRVYDKRYRLNSAQKGLILLRSYFRAWWYRS